jgi:hypothetical protein
MRRKTDIVYDTEKLQFLKEKMHKNWQLLSQLVDKRGQGWLITARQAG